MNAVERQDLITRRIDAIRRSSAFDSWTRDPLLWYLGVWLDMVRDPSTGYLFEEDQILNGVWSNFEIGPFEHVDFGRDGQGELGEVARDIEASLQPPLQRLTQIAADPEAPVSSGGREVILTRVGEWQNRIRGAQKMSEGEATVLDLLQRVRDHAAEVSRVAEATASAASTVGAVHLSGHFKTFADTEQQASTRYRLATIGTIIATFLFGLSSPIFEGAMPSRTEPSGVIYHLALVAALGALATYLGRQSGIHRRNATWARALAVQLDTFPAFVARIDNPQTSSEVHADFARRVMGPPPESTRRSDDATALQTLRDLISLANKT